MATPRERQAGDKREAPPTPGPYLTRQPRRWFRNIALLTALAVAAVLAWTWKGLRDDALVAAAYGAQHGCACRYVSRRPLQICEADLDAAGLGRVAGLLSLSEDPGSRTVTAGVPLLGSQTATFDGRGACMLEAWSG
jgi:hypothetical protein